MAKDPYKYFRVEARELLEQITSGVLQLEKGQADPPFVDGLLRATHTLKGAARVVKQIRIAEDAHLIEGLLSPSREGGGALKRLEIDELLRLVDSISVGLALLGGEPPAAGAQAEPFETLRVDVEEMDALLGDLSDASVQVGTLRQGVDTIGRCHRLATSMTEQIERRRRIPSGERTLSIAEELTDTLSRLHRDLSVSLDRAQSDLLVVRQRAIRARLIPASAIFGVLERTASDVARSVGKSVTFEPHGGDERIDGHVLAALRDALQHVVRNAVDHGIESETERGAAGKSLSGHVTLRIDRRGNRLAFIISDDGRGIDVETVRRVAVAQGLVSPEHAATLSVEEATRLVLKSGVSTHSRVTELSGRGVGLDVVRETVARFDGNVDIRSDPGRGTTIEILVPVSLSSIIVLLFECKGNVISIPLDAVRRAIWLNESQIARSPEGDTILYEGSAIPFCPIEKIVMKSRGSEPRVSPRAARTWLAVVLSNAGALGAVCVDRLIGTSEVAVRPVPSDLGVDPVVAGASFDAEGNPQLVLDPGRLLAALRSQAGVAAVTSAAQTTAVLVVDDSLTTRMLEQSILESAGYQVDLATSGEEALLKARERNYSLFMVDVEMPGMSGFEFISHTRNDRRLEHIPAIILTSRASLEDRRRSEEVGASAFIVKSEFDQTQLLRTIRELVS